MVELVKDKVKRSALENVQELKGFLLKSVFFAVSAWEVHVEG